MANFSGYSFPLQEARRLAGLHGARYDLEAALVYCQRLAVVAGEKLDYVIWEGLWAAAVVRYARCFATGARDRLEQGDLVGAPTDILGSHDYFIAVRNKHIAHPVNEFEETQVTVTLREDESSVTIQGMGVHHSTVVGLAFADIDRLQSLCTWLLARVNTMIRQEEATLLPLAHAIGAERIRGYGTPGTLSLATDVAAKRKRKQP